MSILRSIRNRVHGAIAALGTRAVPACSTDGSVPPRQVWLLAALGPPPSFGDVARDGTGGSSSSWRNLRGDDRCGCSEPYCVRTRCWEADMEATPKLELDDLIVLLLGSPSRIPQLQDRINGVTRLEKLVFLLEKELPKLATFLVESADFESHNFGPFSAKLYSAVEVLEAAVLLEERHVRSHTQAESWEESALIGVDERDDYVERQFRLTERGRRYYEALASELPEALPEQVGELKARFGAIPLRQLIRYVYTRYTEFTDKSLIREQVMGS